MKTTEVGGMLLWLSCNLKYTIVIPNGIIQGDYMYQKAREGWAKHYDFILLDCLCLAISFLGAYWIRHGFHNPFHSELYRDVFPVILVMDFAVILLLNTMQGVLKRGYYREFKATAFQTLGILLCTTTYLFTVKSGNEYSRIVVYGMVILYGISSYVIRILWKKHLRATLSNRTNNALLIMANEESAGALVEEVRNNNYGHHAIVGIVTNDNSIKTQIEDVKVVATYSTVIDYVTQNWVDEVLIAPDPQEPFPEETIDTLTSMGVTVHLNLDKSSKRLGVKQTIGNIGGLLVITSSMNYMTPRQYVIKRGMDILGGLAGCAITGILYLFLAPAIKKESPGPVFFTQERIGKNGKPFKIYKFRSMYLDAEERIEELMKQNRIKDGYMFKMEFDPRVIGNRIDADGTKHTGIGELIRKYSLDEFPQFVNVLRGEMSMVGTRPPLPREYEKYSAHHKARLAAKPGITGLWQVSGRSDILDFEEVVRLDTQYINNWSVGLDIKIILKTLLVVIKKEGSM